jgi:diamine N-acetyltransferase
MDGSGNLPPVIVELRPTVSSDLAAVVDIEGDPEVSPWITRWPLDRHLEALTSPDEAHLSVFEADRLVGFVLLAGLDRSDGVVEIGRIALAKRGGGIGRDALVQTLEMVFRYYAAERVWLDVLPGNERARHLYESLGFAFERVIVGAHPSPDGPLDLLVMSIRQDSWERLKFQE